MPTFPHVPARAGLALLLAALPAPAAEVPRVDGYINGEPVRFIVDTGASEVVVPQALAARLGLDFTRGELARYETAGGMVEGRRVVLESVKVANMEVLGVIAHVPARADGLGDVLLGMSFLKNVTLTVHGGTVSFSP